MTAMFVIILLEQLLKKQQHISELIGVGISTLCLILFGADDFMLPTMAVILGMLTLLRRPIEKGGTSK